MPKSGIIGLDIGYSTIKAIELGGYFGHYQLKKAGEVGLGFNHWQRKELKKPEALGKSLRDCLDQAQPSPIKAKAVNVALPEALSISKVIHLPKMSARELRETIPYEASDFLPMPIEEAIIDWQVANIHPQTAKSQAANSELTTTMEHIHVVAIYRSLAESLIDCLASQGLKLNRLETRSYAEKRALSHWLSKDQPQLILSIDHFETVISLVNLETVFYTSTIKIAPKTLSATPKGSAGVVAASISETLDYVHNRLGEELHIKQILMSGLVPENSDFLLELKRQSGLEIKSGNLLYSVLDQHEINPRFFTACGLAMAG